MSLIQEALEKAGKVQTPETFFETPKREPVPQPMPKKVQRAVLSQPVSPKISPKVEVSPQVLIRVSAVIGLIFLFFGVTFILGKAGKSSVMLAGVQSAASESSVLPLSDAAATKFVLTGITDSGNDKLALINNQVVGIGDRLQEKAFVKEIHGRTVVLEYNNKEIKISL